MQKMHSTVIYAFLLANNENSIFQKFQGTELHDCTYVSKANTLALNLNNAAKITKIQGQLE